MTMAAETFPEADRDADAVRRASPLAEVESDAAIVVLRLDDRECTPHVLQGTAVAIWNEIDGRRTAEAISRRLAQRYRAPEATVQADVRSCLGMLQHAGLIEVSL